VSLRIVLADDSLIVREGMRGMLDSQPDLSVVGTCADLDALLAAVAKHAPDVVVTDAARTSACRPARSGPRAA